MKKLFVAVVIMVLAFAALAACGGSQDELYSVMREMERMQCEPDELHDGGNTVAPDRTELIGEIVEFGGRDWRVLDIDGNYAKLLSEAVISRQRYYRLPQQASTWATSSLRTWLNDEFLNEFSAEDKERIRETYVINNDNPWHGTSGGANTTDKIFLLSIEEVALYFDIKELLELGIDRSNRGYGGVAGVSLGGIAGDTLSARIAYNAEDVASGWWLRSPGLNNFGASLVTVFGYISIDGGRLDALGGVRPALWLNLES